MDKIRELEKEILVLRETLQRKEDELLVLKQFAPVTVNNKSDSSKTDTVVMISDKLPKWAIERYSRQILLPDIGVRGQERLMRAKVLVVGAGGLGCPAAVYLAGAGVGEIGIVDYDAVDITNIHRQILHSESDQNVSKAESAANSLKSINSKIKVTPYNMELNPSNALDLASRYDLLLDCTDNVPTRYMLNDVAVLNKMPLISGSALKMEGQLTVYGYRAENNPNEEDKSFVGPCYRCVFPTPPPAAAVGSCAAHGVAGPVPGAVGTLQALEAIKMIVGRTRDSLLVARMLLFDGDDTSFRNVKLRGRNPKCDVCSEDPVIKELLNYEVVCKMQSKEKDLELNILPQRNRITADQLAETLRRTNRHLLVDVRSEPEFEMCKLDGAVNYPIEKLHRNVLDRLLSEIRESDEVTFICRRGNDSQIAAKKVLDVIEEEHKEKIRDLSGGLHAWSKHIDGDFPVY